jgi:hypothetical protein
MLSSCTQLHKDNRRSTQANLDCHSLVDTRCARRSAFILSRAHSGADASEHSLIIRHKRYPKTHFIICHEFTRVQDLYDDGHEWGASMRTFPLREPLPFLRALQEEYRHLFPESDRPGTEAWNGLVILYCPVTFPEFRWKPFSFLRRVAAKAWAGMISTVSGPAA